MKITIQKIFLSLACLCLCLSAQAQATNVLNGLVLWLPMTNTTGLNVTDESPGGTNDGTLGNFPPDPSYPEWAPGLEGNALLLNTLTNPPANSNEFVYVQDAPNLNFDNPTNLQFTLMCWFNCDTGPAGAINAEQSGATLIDKGLRLGIYGAQQYTMDFNANYIRCYCLNTNGTAFPANASVSNKTGGQVGCDPPFQPVNGVWYHIAWAYSGQSSNLQMETYINGILTNSVTNLSGLFQNIEPSTNGVNVGNRNNTANVTNFTGPFHGSIADVRIYNRVLSAAEITNIVGLAYGLPAIGAPPGSLSRYVGDPAFFSVSANSAAALSYQWLLNGTNITNGVNIGGATSPFLTLTNVQSSQAGSYTVIVSNAFGSVTSTPPAILTVNALPAADTNTALVAYWNLNEGSGSIANDTNPNDPSDLNTATIYGAEWTNGVSGDALFFGANTVAAAPDIGTSDNGVYDFSANPSFTLACWVNGATTQVSGSGIIAKGFGGINEQYTMDTTSSAYRFYVRDANGFSWNLSTSVKPNGGWQHLACVFDATNSEMFYYVNGQIVAWMAPPTTLLPNTHELSFGCRQGGSTSYNDYWAGDMDEVHVYNRALTSRDIQALISVANSSLVAGTISFSSSGAIELTNGTVQFSGSASGGGAVANASYRVWATTNLALPFAQWTPVQTNTFNMNGQFSFVVPSSDATAKFFEVSLP
ncbi:MAG TPA: LamG-like jellyroll fold domain-containing protein [Verrucomicrobiae bacterium]|nr:LamG-like jellyroll fold domain-containing protein [Verrucomicrobiae bacterium]